MSKNTRKFPEDFYKICSVCKQMFRLSYQETKPTDFICEDCKRLNLSENGESQYISRYICPYLIIKTNPTRHLCSIPIENFSGKKGHTLCPKWNFVGCTQFKQQKMKEWSEEEETEEEDEFEFDEENELEAENS